MKVAIWNKQSVNLDTWREVRHQEIETGDSVSSVLNLPFANRKDLLNFMDSIYSETNVLLSWEVLAPLSLEEFLVANGLYKDDNTLVLYDNYVVLFNR
jgi:hypothetical protein